MKFIKKLSKREVVKMSKGNNVFVAKKLVFIAKFMLSSAANSRCAFVYHQPKQPEDVKNFRKF